MVERTDGEAFDVKHYYQNPHMYVFSLTRCKPGWLERGL
jgi:hypothetical protein